MSEEPKNRRTPLQQVAFDSGGGSRCISHVRENPYSAENQPDLHAAWEAGWAAMDAVANALADRDRAS